MRITRITVYQVTLPIGGGGYRLSGGRLFFDKLDSTILSIETDDGTTGWGEGCPGVAVYG